LRLLGLILVTISLSGCSTKTKKPFGHWHESFSGQTIHCYHITDTLVSIDKFTFGYSKKVENGDIFQPLVSYSTFDLLADYDVSENQFTILDTVTWTKMPNDVETFLNDISLGLLVKVEPPELLDSQFDLAYDTFNTRIYASKIFIGQLKNRQPSETEFYIELNEVKATVNDLLVYLVGHSDNSKKIIALHADKGTPAQLIQDVTKEILKAGYFKGNIYRTMIKKEDQTMGLVYAKLPPTMHINHAGRIND
jgi:hypothetical protein